METKENTKQNLLIFLCWMVYTFAYMGRYSYNSNISLIIDRYSITKAQAGIVSTCFFFSYGAGQIVNGIMCKRYNKKILFPLVLVVSAIVNLMAISGLPFWVIKYLWIINGIVQSCLWSSLINVLSTNLDENHLNKAILVMSTTTSIGTFFSYGISSAFAWIGDYRLSFVTGAVVMTVVAVVWLLFFKSSPYKKDDTCKSEVQINNNKLGISFLCMLIIFGIFAVFNNFIKDGLNTWFPKILKDQFNLHDSISILLTLALPVLGIFGAMVAVWLNKFIKNFVSIIVLLFAVSSLFTAIIAFGKTMYLVSVVLCFGIVTCLMHGVNNVITSMGPMKMRDKIDSGKLSGILNGCCYIGSTISSYGLGKISDNGGWSAVFYVILAICITAIIIGISYLFIFRKQKANERV